MTKIIMFVEESEDDAESIIVFCNCIFGLSPHTSCPLNSRFSEQPVVFQLWQIPSPIALMSSEEDSADETSSGSCGSSGGDDISGDGTSEGSDEDSEDQRVTDINSVLSSTEEEESSGEET